MSAQLGDGQLEKLLRAVFCAGRVILDVRKAGIIVSSKQDNSPVTKADQAAEQVLLAALQEQFPQIPVIAEEAVSAGDLPVVGDAFFLVDALDGTKEFIRGSADFTVNIGLIHNAVPVFGIVYAPVDGRLFVGETDIGAWQAKVDCSKSNPQVTQKQPLKTRKMPDEDRIALASRSHRDKKTDAWLAANRIDHIISAGSSLKFCMLAAGEADVYPRFGPTMEWDTAAGHAVLCAAGGALTEISGARFLYGKEDQNLPFLNPDFIATGGHFHE